MFKKLLFTWLLTWSSKGSKAVLRIRIRAFWVTWIRILYPQKDPCNSNFLLIKLSKIQFLPNKFLSLILSVIGCLDLLRKCQNIYFAKHQKHILVLSRIGIRILKTESADPDLKKNGADLQHYSKESTTISCYIIF